jgi:acyl-coenzyme A thioesterase PaaI-like protein
VPRAGEPPDGFTPFPKRGPFSSHIGPFWRKPTPEGVLHGFFVEAHHCNNMGTLHGGMIAAFLDGALAHAAHRLVPAPAVTVRMSVDYLGAGAPGDWIEGRALAVGAHDGLIIVRGEAVRAGAPLMMAQALFKLV